MSVERFGDQLRRHRVAAGMTQETLAERSGLSVRGISDLERGVKQRPHPETVRLLADALGLPADALASFREAAAPRSRVAPLAIPEPLTALVDREDEVIAVAGRLRPGSGIRLVTLTGPGGVGKTRLAIQVAGDVGDRFADGVAFVSLAGLTDHRLVLAALATALGIREFPDRAVLDLLTRQLQDRQALVVMDNFEHLLAAAADLAALLAACRGLTVLATSRAPLRISGEQQFPVRPLALPAPARTRTLASGEMLRSPAVTLFVRQAQAVQPAFDVTEANAASVAAICAKVDGLPLALELAAVRMKTLAPGELDALLGNRLGILTGGPGDHPARHRTMRSTIGWSHDLMPADEQATFRTFAVFVGGATLESAAAVVSDGDTLATLNHLTALMDQSLVQRFDGVDGQPRFVMLETIREYALDQLAASGDDAPVRDLHAAHFLAFAERGETELTGPDQAAWMTRLESEYGNLRAALGWSIGREDAESSQRFGSALWRFWAASGRLNEGRDWLDRALALAPGEVSAVRAQALQRRGNLAVDLADYPTAQVMYEASMAIYRSLGDELNANRALGGIGLVHFNQGEYTAARADYEAALQVWQARGLRHGEGLILHSLGNVAVALGEFTNGRQAYEASLVIHRELDDSGGVAYLEYRRGRLNRLEGDLDAAQRWLTRALAGFHEVGDRLGAAYALNELGSLAHDLDNDQKALRLHLAALREWEESGAIQEVVESLEGIAIVSLAQRQLERGVTLLATASLWRQSHGAPLPPVIQRANDIGLEGAQSKMAKTSFERAWSEGKTITIDQAVDLAFTLTV